MIECYDLLQQSLAFRVATTIVRTIVRNLISNLQKAARRPSRSMVGALSLLAVMGFASACSVQPLAWLISHVAATELPQPGQSFRDCRDGCPEMVVVPTGSFTMGSAEFGEGPQRRVTITKPFAVGKFEVTFAEWDACVAARACSRKPDARWGKGNKPVVSVSWDDAKQFTAWLSRETGRTYRLLTEAEWEYAARAGSTTMYSWGDDIGVGNANCEGCGGQWDGKQPAPVGSFKPNAFGLHDMHGNVWEWVEDCWVRGFDGAPSDGSAQTTGCPNKDERVQRGGAFLHGPRALRSTVRNNYTRDSHANGVGFRVARTL